MKVIENEEMKPTANQIIQFKNSVDEIHRLDNDCWAEIEPLIYIKELVRNDYFSREGDHVRDLGFIFNGLLRIFYLDNKGTEWNKHFLQNKDFVASSISPHKKSITNIQALAKSTLVCVPFYDLMKLSTKYDGINAFIQKKTFSYLEHKQNREISLLSEEAMSNYQAFSKAFPDLENSIQHYHIASYLGITPTQLSRLRKKMDTHQHM